MTCSRVSRPKVSSLDRVFGCSLSVCLLALLLSVRVRFGAMLPQSCLRGKHHIKIISHQINKEFRVLRVMYSRGLISNI